MLMLDLRGRDEWGSHYDHWDNWIQTDLKLTFLLPQLLKNGRIIMFKLEQDHLGWPGDGWRVVLVS